MPRFELKEGSSGKFWEITLAGSSCTARWGYIGTEGQSKTQTFDSPTAAWKVYEKLIIEKEKRGYVMVGKEGAAEASSKARKRVSASNPELEAAILADLDNTDAWLVYGDWLQRQDDPRGQLVALQHAVMQARGDEATKLKGQVKDLIEKGRASLLGEELAEALEEGGLQVEWHLGFIRSARVGLKDEDDPTNVTQVVKALLVHPAARFLRELTIGNAHFGDDISYSDIVEALTEALTWLGGSKTLQRLFIGDFEYPDDYEISWLHLHDVSAPLKLLPNLRSLRLRGASLEIGDIDLPELREFTVETGGLPLSAVRSIANARWPKLERLEVWFGSHNYGGEGGVEDIQPILDGKGLPHLKHLGLRNAEFTDDLCEVLPHAKVLPRLETLDLSMGAMSDQGARILAENARAFAHLKRLDVSRNTLTDEGQQRVAQMGPSVNAGNQRDYEEDYRYVAVGE
ncbi:WGR domain-containing protein [Pyxidicoccus fallax]|uniref:WGR domain-containing protein n=1 Tax=Pyxidicoccus fallax TaxID=394095 RepID=A0A848LPL9_9BACT|nr:WGR domain-containing protein [Pyxidicoccus fallax]NMO19828.1 WGR domain-containing protein [Pyxidicoccus fallax]NPC77345.1 WGR domain-containing protein [Pyxidicoccus fallax]